VCFIPTRGITAVNSFSTIALLIIALCLVSGCSHAKHPVHHALTQVHIQSTIKDSRRPSGQLLWENFQLADDDHLGASYAGEVWNRVGGSLGSAGAKGNWLPCAGRLSYALDRSGQKIPAISHVTYRNSDGYHYILRASDMRKYLRKKWGKPDYAAFGVSNCVPYSPSFLNSIKLGDGVAVFATNGHVGIIKAGYDDPMLAAQGVADIWKLPS
jgi:hypothetical protein